MKLLRFVLVAASLILFSTWAEGAFICSMAVTNTTDSGAGSLRDAIACSNGTPGPNTITFNIPGPGVHVIQPLSGLPGILTTVTIDGYSQPGSSPNALVNGDNAVILIQIDGGLVPILNGVTDGITVGAANSLVRGLSVTGFSGNGIGVFFPGDSAAIQGCFVGVAPDGMTAAGNVRGILGYVGTVIGGTTPGARNIISGNLGAGIQLSFISGCVIQGNYIGTDATGMFSLGNAGDGIVSGAVLNGLIGGTVGGAGNIVAFNGGVGVLLGCPDGCGTGDGILGNSIFSNAGVGISLGGVSPLANDPCDVDGGFAFANQGQNYPVLTRAEVVGNTTVIEATLNSVASTSYRVELFSSPACDRTGFGQGRTFLGSTTVNTDPSCNGSFSFSLPGALPAGSVVTATATDPSNNTSEFSACLAVSNGPCIQVAPPLHLLIDSPIAAQGSTVNLTWDAPSQGFAGAYIVQVSTDGGATFTPFASTAGNQMAVLVKYPVGTTVIFEVLADLGCGPAGVSDPSPTVSLQVVQTCPRVGDPAALVDQLQVAVGDAWLLHWTATLPGPLSAPAGVYEVRISRDNGVSFQVAGTTTQTSFTGGPVPQADLGKLIFLQVIARPSCGGGGSSAGHSNVVFFQVVFGCEAPQSPRNPQIAAVGKRVGDPIFPTDRLLVSWDAPSSGNPPSGYLYRINGDLESLVVGSTGNIAHARGSGDPITLFVRSVACSPRRTSAFVQSATVALAVSPPVANFTVSPNPKVGQAVILTDTSSPQATAWLWLFDDGAQSAVQSPSKTFATAGTHTVALIATNGAGSSSKLQSFFTAPASAAVSAPLVSATVAFSMSEPGRRRTEVELTRQGEAWLRLASSSTAEETLFLRFLDAEGTLVQERRLVVQAGSAVTHDLGAYGLRGSFMLELVGESIVSAAVVRTGHATTVIQR